MKKIIIWLLMIIIIFSLIGCGKTPEEVFQEFDKNKELALQDYNKLSDKNRNKVNELVKNELQKIYDENNDYTSTISNIEKYNNINELNEDIEIITDKTYSRMLYIEAENIIGKYGKIENIGLHDGIETVVTNYSLITPNSEYYDEVSKKINYVRKVYRDKYIKEWGVEPVGEEFELKEPQIGMTESEVINNTTWGRPKDINKTTTKYGVSEQWVYDNYKYLYFEDGVLTTIQE